MALKASTGLRNYTLDTGSLKAGLASGSLKIYSGAVPADADAAVTGTLLVTISESSGGTGLSLATSASGGVITKDATTWSGVVSGAGTQTATYWRLTQAGDTGVLSTTERRLQGLVATSGAEMVMTSTALTNGATQTIDYFSIAAPTL